MKVSVLKCLSKMVSQYADKVEWIGITSCLTPYILSVFNPQAVFVEQVLEVAQSTVHNTHHGVRVECLKLIGQLCHVTAGTCKTPLAVLEDHCADPDPRVRSASFQALVRELAMGGGGGAAVTFDLKWPFLSIKCTARILNCCH